MRNAVEYLRLTFIKCQWKIVSWGMWETTACSAGIIIIINDVSESEWTLPSIHNVSIYFSLTCWMTFGDKRRVDVKYSFVTMSSSPALRISLISVSRVLSFGLLSVFWARRSWGQMMTQVSLSILVSVSGLTAPTREITAALRVWPEPLSSLRLWRPGSLHFIS